ncbi:hypothetical protein DH2020_024042 [Rehmannia glutinosa]|uniref:Glycosyltransferase N-terminal domain-containing protein n=1 Tax=Rehmannia glutinosa TaxID=99300 RepID=A0ABR0W9G7_REHGL
MDSIAINDENKNKPHAVFIPYPAQGHVNPMFKLAKLLHHKGFYITFVNTEYNHRRLLKSRGSSAVDGLPEFRFATIPDGLPPSDADATQDILSLCASTTTTCLEPFCDLLSDLNSSGGPPVSCIVSDVAMNFTLTAAERFGLPEFLFCTTSACGFGICALSPSRGGRLYPTQSQSFDHQHVRRLEHDVLVDLSSMFPRIYTVGPLHLMANHIHDERLNAISSSFWKEESECIKWLDEKEPQSVVYVNFGSITVVTAQQLTEFAWGLANSKRPFLWIIRPDIIVGESPCCHGSF